MTRREWLVAAVAAPLAAQSPDLDGFFQEFLEQWVKAGFGHLLNHGEQG